MAGNGGRPSVNSKATITNGVISSQSVSGVKSVAGASHTVASDVSFWFRGQLLTLRTGEPFVADAALLVFCSANNITVTAN